MILTFSSSVHSENNSLSLQQPLLVHIFTVQCITNNVVNGLKIYTPWVGIGKSNMYCTRGMLVPSPTPGILATSVCFTMRSPKYDKHFLWLSNNLKQRGANKSWEANLPLRQILCVLKERGILPPFSLIHNFGKQNTRGNVSKSSVSLTCYRHIGSKVAYQQTVVRAASHCINHDKP